MTIDATTGPGGAVSLDSAQLATTTSVGLEVSGATDVVQGFVFRHDNTAVLLDSKSGHDTVRANLIGIDATGSDTGVSTGVLVRNSPGNVIGGGSDADRNTISDVVLGVWITGAAASGTKVQGNFVGTNDAQRLDAAVQEGVLIVDASGTVVGGPAPAPGQAPGNVIDGVNTSDTFGQGGTGSCGVCVAGNAARVTGTVVQGNLVGLRQDGTTLAPGSAGQPKQFSYDVLVAGRTGGTLIGGTVAADRNVVADAGADQIQVDGTLTTGTQVLGNYVGTDATGLHVRQDVGNPVGVAVRGASSTTVGSPGGGNVIMGQSEDGVLSSSTSTPIGLKLDTGTVTLPGTNDVKATGATSTLVSGNIIGPGADGTTVDAEHVQRVGVQVTGVGDTVGAEQSDRVQRGRGPHRQRRGVGVRQPDRHQSRRHHSVAERHRRRDQRAQGCLGAG